ncbi:hypothetical protein ACYSNO_04010 [Enterococcus sp. LJL98]
MRSLEKVKEEFEAVKNNESLNTLQKTMRFVCLMDELEQDYHTFIINPTDEQLASDEVKLYREISYARVF